MFKRVLILWAILAFCTAVTLILWPEHREKNVEFAAPMNLNGSWSQRQGDDSSTNMRAEISGNHIKIMMYSHVVSGLYWDGSFDTGNTSSSSFEVTSASDSDSLSQTPTKTFKYKDGVISFDFTMLGVTKTVHLYRGA